MSTHDDTPRELQAATLFGTIESVDVATATCRVRSGDILTDAVPWAAQRAGTTRRWSPPTVGEQVVLLCPGGDTHGAVALLGLYTTSNAAPSASADEDVTEYPDGTRIVYNHAAKKLTATLADGGEIDITATKIKITGDVEVDGKIDCTKTVTATEDVIGGGKSLKTHPHTGVQSGSGTSGPPA
ncbi:phage baseplate assembly protein V [Lysobacter brunescens]|uniref:Phage baseplate assembly protein V n=1 Tax=Lysobacter brunescens TaxID=262323 RepID=A0ABW2YJC0_9GAMM